MLRNPCILGVPNAKRGEKIRIGFLTPAFSGGQKRAEMLRNPCVLGGPLKKGTKSKVATSGRKCYTTPAFSGVPYKKGKIKSGLSKTHMKVL